MEKRGLKRGLATLCGGGGSGQAIIIEEAEKPYVWKAGKWSYSDTRLRKWKC